MPNFKGRLPFRELPPALKTWENVNLLENSYWQRLCIEYNKSKPEGRNVVTCMDIIDKGKSMKRKYDSSITSQGGISLFSTTKPTLFELFRPCENCLSKISVFHAFVMPDPLTDNTSENVTISSGACSDGGNSSDKMMEILDQMTRDGKLCDAEFLALISMSETFASHIVIWVLSKDTPPELALQFLKNM